jgi:hypothetical protein
MGGYTSKCEKKSKSLHPTEHASTWQAHTGSGMQQKKRIQTERPDARSSDAGSTGLDPDAKLW